MLPYVLAHSATNAAESTSITDQDAHRLRKVGLPSGLGFISC